MMKEFRQVHLVESYLAQEAGDLWFLLLGLKISRELKHGLQT